LLCKFWRTALINVDMRIDMAVNRTKRGAITDRAKALAAEPVDTKTLTAVSNFRKLVVGCIDHYHGHGCAVIYSQCSDIISGATPVTLSHKFIGFGYVLLV